MPAPDARSLLAQLTGRAPAAAGADPTYSAVAARPPAPETPVLAEAVEGGRAPDAKLEDMLARIQRLTSEKNNDSAKAPSAPAKPAPAPASPAKGSGSFVTPRAKDSGPRMMADPAGGMIPLEPVTFRDAELTDVEVEALVLKYLLARGEATGRGIADQVKLPFLLIDELLRRLKQEQLVVYSGSAALNDYVCRLTDLGLERARRYNAHCTYFGSAPVCLRDYVASVRAQSLEHHHPTVEELQHAFEDLLITPEMLARLGPAINSGRGMFLYGAPGNGKTSVAERVARSFGQTIWIPRALGIDGEIIRLFDPVSHEETPLDRPDGLLDQRGIDHRWVRIKRPCIVAGGELTMENLEVTINTSTGVNEAPMQLKSNCGVLVIDDFGRQKMRIDQLLNRWIVPLEKRYDFLNLPNGKKIQVPFDQLIIFSTNLEPKQLVDEAFLRRIPYKIEITDPQEPDFRRLFQLMCQRLGVPYDEGCLDYLVQKHYLAVRRPFRACQPRDLILQVRNYCLYQKIPPQLTPRHLDYAVENYFAVM